MKQTLTQHIKPTETHIHRIVESQEKSATLRLVDNFEEQDLLEQLIETSKPPGYQQDRHYLIATPFRYPPLEYGSRFGGRFEPSLFYGAHSVHTMLHETAYYTFYFMSAMAMPFTEVIINHKTSFQVLVKSKQYINLADINQTEWQTKLNSKDDYRFSQQVGTSMREQGIEAFSYFSARDPDSGLNMGVFSIDAIQDDPQNIKQWQIKQTPSQIMFSCTDDKNLNQVISIETYTTDGTLPAPSY